MLEDEIKRMTEKDTTKDVQKRTFKQKKRMLVLQKATPYSLQSLDSIGH